MKYDFVEIGTCDYHTLLESCPSHQVGLSVEPIKTYLDRLPDKPNVTKVNCAISSEDKLVDLYWVEPVNQEKYNLQFTKGWGTIITPHKGHSEAARMLAEGMLTKQQVQAITWQTLCNMYDITEVDYVKIDAEGHDCVIVKSIINTNILPNKISFEKTHCKIEELEEVKQLLAEKNFYVVSDDEDMTWQKR